MLARSTLQGASFTAPRQLREAIDAFVQVYNSRASPFAWTKTVVHPKGLTERISHLHN